MSEKIELKNDIPVPPDAYTSGENEQGGRKAKYPFMNMEVGQCAEIELPSGKERAIKRGRVMAAIRNVTASKPGRQFRTKDHVHKEESEPTKTKLILRVWRTA